MKIQRRGQFSFEALLMIAAYFAFLALLVSAVSGQAKNKNPDEGTELCRALFSVSSWNLQANLSGFAAPENLSECNASFSAGGRMAVAEKDWR